MKLQKIAGIASAVAITLALSGCATPAFTAHQKESLQIVTKLQKGFNLSGFTPDDVIGGEYNFETGGTPNARFAAKADTSLSNRQACTKADRYFNHLNVGKVNFYPRMQLQPDHAIVECIAALKGFYAGDFEWHGKLKTGKKFGVILSRSNPLQLTVTTDFPISQYDSGFDEGGEFIQDPPALTAFVDGFQTYRVRHGINLYTPSELAKANLVAETKDFKITPVVSKDGFIRRLHIQYFDNFTYDQCFSAMPWSVKEWDSPDPGPNYPFFTVETNDELTTYGAMTLDSDCKKMPLHPIQ